MCRVRACRSSFSASGLEDKLRRSQRFIDQLLVEREEKDRELALLRAKLSAFSGFPPTS
jgi:hypothetical protein